MDILFNIKPVDLILAYIVLLIGLIIHEFGHASAARYLNVSHHEIGVGIYLLFFVFYTDVSYAWTLKRKQRLVVNFGGMYFQSIFLVILHLAYILFPADFIYYSVIFVSLGVVSSLNPFVKFDGYWILADLIGIENLGKKVNSYLSYSAKKILFRDARNPISDFKKMHRYIFYLYFWASVFFISSFLVSFLVMLPNLVGEIIAQFKLLFLQFQTHNDLFGFILGLTQKLFIVVAFSFFLIKALYLNLS